MAAHRRPRWLLAPLLLAVPAFAQPMLLAEPLDSAGGTWWLEAAPALVVDPLSRELHPARAQVAGQATYQFRLTTAQPHLTFRFSARLDSPGDAVRCSVSPTGTDFLTVAEATWQASEQAVELTPYLVAGRPLFVRLALFAAQQPERVAVAGLSWLADGVARVPPPPRPPRGAWLYPAWAALAEHRVAPGLPPGAPVTAGDGRIERRVTPDEALVLPPPRPGRVRLLLAPAGRLRAGEAEADGGPGPVGLALTPRVAPRGAPLAFTLEGAREARLVDLGPLEIRHLRPRITWRDGCQVWLDATVVNHTSGELAGTLRGRLLGPTGEPVEVAAGGYRFPPGAWLAPLAFRVRAPERWAPGRPRVYRAELLLDDGSQVSDAASLPVGLKEVVRAADGWWLNGRRLDAGEWRTLAVPADPAALATAAAAGVPVVLAAADAAARETAELVCGGRPEVLAVTAPNGEPD